VSTRAQEIVLALLLVALAVLFAVWFAQDKHWLATQLVFTLPPLLLALGVLVRRGEGRVWAGGNMRPGGEPICSAGLILRWS